MNSMTGFGRGTAERDGNAVTIEITAVNNRKQTDIRVALPRDLAPLEPGIKARVQERICRGSVTVSVSASVNPQTRGLTFRLDPHLAARAAADLRELASQAGIEPRLTLADLLQIPGILRETESTPADIMRQAADEALNRAVDALRESQRAEGLRLHRELSERLAVLTDLLDCIAAKVDDALVAHRDRLRDRIALLGIDLPIDDERLAREVAFYAEKSDITEEVVRLRSHLEQCRELLQADRDVGRDLEFLCQEMGREAGTLGAKTADTRIAEWGITLRAELARLREQVMNVE